MNDIVLSLSNFSIFEALKAVLIGGILSLGIPNSSKMDFKKSSYDRLCSFLKLLNFQKDLIKDTIV